MGNVFKIIESITLPVTFGNVIARFFRIICNVIESKRTYKKQ